MFSEIAGLPGLTENHLHTDKLGEKEMKDYILRLIDSDIGAAKDNIIRAEIGFRNIDMSEKYGNSNQTCQEIMAGYKSWLERANKAREWILTI